MLQRNLDKVALHEYATSLQQQLSKANTERTTIDRVSAEMLIQKDFLMQWLIDFY